MEQKEYKLWSGELIGGNDGAHKVDFNIPTSGSLRSV
jgi:hypothetical protein